MRNHTIIGTLVLSSSLLLGACEKKAPQPPLSGPTPVTPKGAPGPLPPGANELPPGHPPVAADGGMATPAPADAAANLGSEIAAVGVTVTVPDGWKRQPPASSMRIAEVLIPNATDPAKSALAVFSSAGGSVQENVARWAGQVRGEDGAPVNPNTETKTIDGMEVTLVELNGTVSGMGIQGSNPNWTIRGAIVQAPQGMLFIKVYGPTETIAAQADAFNAMINSLKKS